jgi:hypothetical protein
MNDRTCVHSTRGIYRTGPTFATSTTQQSPTPLRHPILLPHLPHIYPHHRLSQITTNLRQHLGIPKMRHRLHNSLRPLPHIARLENPTPHKNAIAPQLHHERRIRRRRDAPRGEIDDGQTPQPSRLLEQVEGGADRLGEDAQLHVGHVCGGVDLGGDGADVLDGLDDVAGAGLALGADHGGAFGDAPQGFAQVAAAADEGHFKGVFFDVVDCVGGGEDFGFVDVVDAEGFEDLDCRGGRMSVGGGGGKGEGGDGGERT